MPDIHVIGVVPNRSAADQVVGNLRLAGFPQHAISVIMVRDKDTEALDHLQDQHGEESANVAGNALKGAGIGAAIGLAAGFGTLFIPGLEILSDWILLALFGGTGAFVGTLSGAFSEEGVSNQVINRYGMALREGQAVINVHAGNAEIGQRAQDVLIAAGAANVNSYMDDITALERAEGVTTVSH